MNLIPTEFKDINQGQWFQDSGGRRMVKLQETNGCVYRHYVSFSTEHDIVDDIGGIEPWKKSCLDKADGSGLISLGRGRGIMGRLNDKYYVNSFNAVDEKGIFCQCPEDVEFYVEES